METAPVAQPDITPVAAPTRIRYTIPAIADDPSWNDLAAGLAKMDSGLSSFVDARQAKQDAVDKVAGEAAFAQNNSKGYAQGVADGSIPAQWSPAMMDGYKAAQGNLAGDTFAAGLQAAWDQYPGKNDPNNPNAYADFAKAYTAKNLGQGATDPAIASTLMPRVHSAIAQGYEKATLETHEATIQKYKDTESANVYNAIGAQQAAANASGMAIDPATIAATVGQSYVRAINSGVGIEQAQQLAVQQIAFAAHQAALGAPQSNNGMSILAALDEPLPNGVVLSQTEFGAAKKTEMMQQIQELSHRDVIQGIEVQKQIDAKEGIATKGAIQDWLFDPANNGAPPPEAMIKAAEKTDPTIRTQIVEWGKIKNEQPSDPQQLMAATNAILQPGEGGGMAAWMRNRDEGRYQNNKDLLEQYNLAKGMEGAPPVLKDAMNSPAYKQGMDAIKARTNADKLSTGLGLDAVGETNEGFALKYDFNQKLMAWAKANPSADYQAQSEQIAKLTADALKSVITPSATGAPAVIAPVSPSNPFGGPAPGQPGVPVQQPAPPQAPPAETKGGMPAPPNLVAAPPDASEKARAAALNAPADPATVQAWAASLPPDQQQKMQQAAAAKGIDLQAFAAHAYSTLRANGAIPGAKPPPTSSGFGAVPQTLPVAPATPVAPGENPVSALRASMTQDQKDDQTSDFQEAVAKWQATDPDAAAKIHQFTSMIQGVHASLPYQGTMTVAALKGNPQASHLLDFVAGPESTGNYNAFYGHGNSQAPLDNLTLAQILQKQHDMVAVEGMRSSAIGRYQFMPNTLRGLMTQMNIPASTLFTPELQDNLALQLLKNRGLEAWQKGQLSDTQFANNLAKEWASLPNMQTGRSQYAGDGLNKSLVTPGQVAATLRTARGLPAMDAMPPPAMSQPAEVAAPATASSTTTTTTTDPMSAVYYGDSIAHIAKIAAGAGAQGVTTDGRSPAAIYQDIVNDQHTPVAGKTVVLSSASNNVNDLASTEKSIRLLISRGVKPSDIKLVGVGDFGAAKTSGLNGKLQALAAKTGATFTGPLDTNNLRPDRVHPANGQQFLQSVLGGGRQVAGQ